LGSGPDFNKELDSRIKEITKNKDRWILIGGPPCQAYSVIGRARNSRNKKYNPEEDERTHLYKEYLRILAKHKPAVFLMENVKGIISSKLNGRSIIDKIIQDLERPSIIYRKHGKVSYRIFSLVKDADLFPAELKPVDFVIECEGYGIPQKRHRLILLGIREDLYVPPKPQTLKEGKQYKVSDIIEGLPKIRSGLSREDDNAETWAKRLKEALHMPWLEDVKRVAGNEVYKDIKDTIKYLELPEHDRGNEYIPFDSALSDDFLSQWYIDPRIGGVCNHHSKSHMIEDIYRYLYVSSFGKYYGKSPHLDDFPNDLLPKHENVNSGYFSDRFRVQLWDQPSSTITSHLEKDGHYFIHPDTTQCRSLTVREAARLQTFPDNYFFCGGKKQQYKQVGNAVPPLLAYNIAKIIKEYLDKI
jgi:DNA (cytosine-5)-methyltransferase 1